MNLDRVILERCKAITKEIRDDPLSEPFREPFRNEDYLKQISRPMDLSTVLNNLKNNYYKNFNCWANDMLLIFDNSLKYNEKSEFFVSISTYLKKKTQKRINQLYLFNMRNYEAKLFELIKSMNKLIESPPETLHVKPNPGQYLNTIEDFSKETIEKIVSGLNEKANNNQFPEISEILKNSDDSVIIGENLEIDIAAASRKTLNQLDNYLKNDA